MNVLAYLTRIAFMIWAMAVLASAAAIEFYATFGRDK